jgi:KaiC/GvpD/RAD55 family RecA-like ATPase
LVCRLIRGKAVLEGEFSNEEITKHNLDGYNVYYLPNPPTTEFTHPINGSHITEFTWCFVDFDLKTQTYPNKESFYEAIGTSGISPCKIVDSGNGVHVYWKISNLDAISYLSFQRRLCRLFNTDEAVGKIMQLMRLPGTLNTKSEPYKECLILYENADLEYTSEEFNKLLPPLLEEDKAYCQRHYNQTYNLNDKNSVSDTLPPEFGKLLKSNKEVKELFTGTTNDRSKSDYRLAHIMYSTGFTKDQAMSVLVNCAKALERAPAHRISYAQNIVEKIWTYEETGYLDSPTVKDILSKGDDTVKGIRFPCNKIIDDTVHGFRLGQVIGIIGGAGVGKTTLTLNTFLWFAESNPEYHHFFFSLEQPAGEIANRIKTICQGNDRMFDKIHIISNYDSNGDFKHFSMDSIEKHLSDHQKNTGNKIGAVVVDHIGVLSKSDKNGEMEGLIGVCKRMKSVAQKINCMIVMLSQAPREKAGAGDLELGKDAAYGTVFFESFCDYCICLWQPLKRVYDQGAPTVMAIKFAKIRHKKQNFDNIKEDVCYQLYFDPKTELLRELTQEEETAAKFFLNVATNQRKLDRKTDLVPYKSRRIDEPKTSGNRHN